MVHSSRVAAASSAILVSGFLLTGVAFATPFTNGSFESPEGASIRQGLSSDDTFVTGWINTGTGQIHESLQLRRPRKLSPRDEPIPVALRSPTGGEGKQDRPGEESPRTIAKLQSDASSF